MATMLQDALLERTDREPSVVAAKLHGGPYDGTEHWIFRVRTDYLRRVRRGRLARALNRPPRYAWYQLVALEDDSHRAEYVFRGIRSARRAARARRSSDRVSSGPRDTRRRVHLA